MAAAQCPEISVIVPFFNEEESIRGMYAAIVAAIDPLGVTFEMVFVDDGSRDRTVEIATELARIDARVRIVKFRRNYGQTPAMAAGIEHASGKILITMDGDLQNDPGDIRHFLDKMNEGYDIVVGWRHNRQDKLVSRKIPSKIANWLIGRVTGVPIRDNGCSLKAYRGFLDQGSPSLFRDASLHPRNGVNSGSTHRGNQGTASRPAIRQVQIWALPHLQGASRSDGNQDRCLVYFSAAALVQSAVPALVAHRIDRHRLLPL